jgi:ABC-type glycerol-3-phosphate transport system permease component
MVRIDFEKYARGQRIRWWAMRFAIYGLLVIWAFVCVFPLFWTVSTSFKTAADVMRGNLIPWFNFAPNWLGWRSLGLSRSCSDRSRPTASAAFRTSLAICATPTFRSSSCRSS